MSQDLAKKFDTILDALSGLDGRLADVEQRIDTKGTLGFRDSPSTRRILYANRTNGHLWYFWDRDEKEPTGVDKRCLRGFLVDVFMYEKGDEESVKVCGVFDVGTEEISVEFGATATAGRAFVASLRAANPAAFVDPITIEVEASDPEKDSYDSALLVDMYAEGDAVLTESEDWPPKGDPDTIQSMVTTFRDQMGWSPSSPYEAAPEGVKQTGDSAAQEVGADAHRDARQGGPSGSQPKGNGREKHPSEKAYSGDGMPMYEPNDPPPIDREAAYVGTGNAKQAWVIAQEHGHTQESFVDMCTEAFGVEKPQHLPPKDWEEFWTYLDRDYWEANRDTFEEGAGGELPF